MSNSRDSSQGMACTSEGIAVAQLHLLLLTMVVQLRKLGRFWVVKLVGRVEAEKQAEMCLCKAVLLGIGKAFLSQIQILNFPQNFLFFMTSIVQTYATVARNLKL